MVVFLFFSFFLHPRFLPSLPSFLFLYVSYYLFFYLFFSRQVLQAQSSMQALLLASYSRAFQTCTTSSSYGTLSTKEKRCLQQMISNDIEARSLIAQHIAAQHQASGKDF